MENYIKVDGEPDKFGDAIRYSKKGKGRYDLIPSEVVYLLIGFGELKFAESNEVTVQLSDIIKDAYIEDDHRYIDTLIDFVTYHYAPGSWVDGDYDCRKVSYHNWLIGFMTMMKELSIHYEMGAEKYGIDNWKKGIPLIGGERGGSFTDSGLRHLNQWILGEEDEKHDISFVWNFFNAIYLQLNENVDFHTESFNKELLAVDEAYSFGD